jgi:phosphoribosylanthranilate isomerase
MNWAGESHFRSRTDMQSDPIRIKICGIRDEATAECAIESGADMIGFVFVKASPRYLDMPTAKRIAESVSRRVQVVGLFKDASTELISECAEQVALDLLQLHGEPDPAFIESVAPRRVLRAVAFDAAQFAETLRRWDGLVRDHHAIAGQIVALIVDTPDPSRIGGGTGRSFDWSALRDVLDEVKPHVPIVLAGGLTPDNVTRAIEVVHPWAVDVSSGVESERGVKDPARIRAFCEAVRTFNASRG